MAKLIKNKLHIFEQRVVREVAGLSGVSTRLGRKKGFPGPGKVSLRKFKVFYSLFIVLAMLIPSLAMAESQEVKAIEARLQQYETHFNNQDARKISELFAENVVYYDALGRVHDGRAAVRELYQQNFRAGFGRMTIETIEVEVFENTAYDIARYTVVSPTGEPLVGYHLAILSNESGEWTVQRTLVNAVMPEPQGQ